MSDGKRLEPKVIVGFMRSDPEPVVVTVPLAGDRAIASANLYGVNAALLLGSQRRMPRIGLKEREILLRSLCTRSGSAS